MLSRTIVKQRAFIKSYKGFIGDAAEEAGISRRCHSRWMETDRRYARRFRDVEQDHIESLELECDRRAVEGFGGKLRFSDALLMFRLRALAPDRYRDHGDTNIVVPIAVSTESPGGKLVEMMNAIHVGPEEVEVKQVSGAVNGHANGAAE